MESINWTFCQNNSDRILADGILKLKKCSHCGVSDISFSGFGNYLISYNDKPYYIGEGRNLRSRLKQQFKPTTSTFFKNYQKSLKGNHAMKSILIDNFSIRYIQTNIGRKEIEDFGIVNLATSLNNFQIGKRSMVLLKENGLWDKVQNCKDELLLEGETNIFKQKFTPWNSCKVEMTAGIYIVKHNSEIIYIGESSNINERHNTHSNRTYFSALRRHIGTEILKHELQERNGRKKYFHDKHDLNVSNFLAGTTATFCPISFGRYELEEFLIKKYRPLLNRKDNKEE